MVSIVSKPTTVWSSGYNGNLTISNTSIVNYGLNWSILCTLPTGSSITWSDSLQISGVFSNNQVSLKPKSWVTPLTQGVVLNVGYGGLGSIPITFKFVSGTPPTPIPPTPIPPTPIPPTPIPPTPIPPTPTPPTPIPPTPIPPTPTPPRVNSQKRIVYIGYWLTDSVIQPMVTSLKNSGVTHILLTFITQPDITKPLTGNNSMLSAFTSLQPINQNLLLNNFQVGISVGGALGMPVPYSLTFSQSNSYYFNNPQKYATDIYNIVKGTGLQNYIDLDIEGINDMFPQVADFVGNVCKQLKTLNPSCIIGHAPQPPYFCPQFGNVYSLIYKNYNAFFDYFFIQYYNNGPSQTFQQIFTQSDSSVAPGTSVMELVNGGINPSYIVVGKTVSGESNSSNGFIPLSTGMTPIIQQAFQTPYLNTWCKSGGVGVWYYDSQNTSNLNNSDLSAYLSSVSKMS